MCRQTSAQAYQLIKHELACVQDLHPFHIAFYPLFHIRLNELIDVVPYPNS